MHHLYRQPQVGPGPLRPLQALLLPWLRRLSGHGLHRRRIPVPPPLLPGAYPHHPNIR